ncbi:hypothetical protein [Geoalkalibacter halelectricus]|uniref:hypothetical protein n=1 Tax=Geoalkalibacter halelectricus TaxID=2847045 RepID=UPI003D23CAC4
MKGLGPAGQSRSLSPAHRPASLARFMLRFLTEYAISFNLRHTVAAICFRAATIPLSAKTNIHHVPMIVTTSSADQTVTAALWVNRCMLPRFDQVNAERMIVIWLYAKAWDEMDLPWGNHPG